MQDSRGYIWFATDKGVARYNGYSFTTFTTSEGLSDNQVFDIYEDSRQRIWFACYNGTLCYYHQGKFHNKNNTPFLALANSPGPGLKLIEDTHHNLFYLTHFNIIKIDSLNKVSTLEKKTQRLYSTLALNEKKQVLSLSGEGILNISTGQFFPIELKSEFLAQMNSKGLIHNSTFYYTQKNALILKHLQNANDSIIRFPLTTTKTIVQALYFDTIKQRMLIGTQNGIVYWDHKNNVSTGQAFQFASVSGFCRDNEHNLWVTSLNKGVFLCINTNMQLIDQSTGLGFDRSLCLNAFEDHTIAVGSGNFQCAFIKKEGVYPIQLPKEPGEGAICHIRKGINGMYYVAVGSRLLELDKNFNYTTTLEVGAKDIAFVGQNKIIIALGSCIISIDKSELNNQVLNRIYKGGDLLKKILLAEVKASGLYQSPDSVIYAYGGFGIKKLLKDRFISVSTHEAVSRSITDVSQSSDGTLWMASGINGVVMAFNDSIYTITAASGLSSDFVNGIYTNSPGTLWAATNKGLSKINYGISKDKVEFNIKNYSSSDGLPGNFIYDIIQLDSLLYVATERGIAVFRQQDIDKQHPFDLKLNFESFSFNDSVITEASCPEVQYNQNSLKIRFSCISPSSLRKISYRYRLRGLSDEWSYTTGTSLEYPSLPPGEYEFQLQAFTPDNKASKTIVFKFRIHPAFWQTWWFALIILLFCGTLLLFIVRNRIKAIRKAHQLREHLLKLENEKLESQKKQAIFEKELLELEQQALRLHMNPHFIFNSINTIQGFYAGSDIVKAQLYISKFSSLLRMILDFSKEKSITLSQEIRLTENYLELNSLRFENKFTFEIYSDSSLNKETTQLPPMLIQPFIENAIIHGVAPLNKMGNIAIRFFDDGKFIRCEIEDNGIGRKRSQELKELWLHKSTGIHVTEERIKLINNSSDKQIIITDLQDECGNAAGTLIQFSILKEEYWK